MSTRILVIGRAGQLATELQRLTPPQGVTLEALGRRDAMDLADLDALAAKLKALRPAAIINAGAYTAVDQAESDAAAAFALNRDAPAALARISADIGAALVHLSTDYVFDGAKSQAYVETDAKAPLNIYGRSKSEGEDVVLTSGADAAVIRTSWVFAAHGTNFVRTMLRLAESGDDVRIVADQIGRPTWAKDLAQCCLTVATRLLEREQSARGLFHFAGAGDASWAQFAEAIFAENAARGGKSARVTPITTGERPTPALRPRNSRLHTGKIESTFGVHPRPWREALRLCLTGMG